jgi:nucleoside-diphosphate kinase
MQKTLVILKPDAVTRGITGEIISRLERKGLKLVASKMVKLTEEQLKEHYSHLVDKPFFPGIVSFMTSAPVILQVWEGKDVVEVVRLMAGVTNSRQAQPGTIRGDYSMSIGNNVIHASENLEAANEEIARFFDENEIHSYKRADEDMLYSPDERE